MKKIRAMNCLPADACYADMESPVGVLILIASAKGVHALLWATAYERQEFKSVLDRLPKSEKNPIILQTKKQLTEYFNGKRKQFDLPLSLSGTEFQLQAWQQLTKIPYGTTISYGEQATRVGDKKKARAVGMANGQNPISIIVPCHRVIGSNGQLTGFGGGLDKKITLLELEQMSLSNG